MDHIIKGLVDLYKTKADLSKLYLVYACLKNYNIGNDQKTPLAFRKTSGASVTFVAMVIIRKESNVYRKTFVVLFS